MLNEMMETDDLADVTLEVRWYSKFNAHCSVYSSLTVIIVFVPLDIGDHAGHIHGAEEARRVPHRQAHVLRGLQDVGEAAHFYCRQQDTLLSGSDWWWVGSFMILGML